MATLKISYRDCSSSNLDEQLEKLHIDTVPQATEPYQEAILFLRAVDSRASQALPAFYLLLGASCHLEDKTTSYSKLVLAHSIRFSSALTVSLCCRKVFDESRDKMTGKRFANISDADLIKVADYWSKNPGKNKSDAIKALNFLRDIFKRCSWPIKNLVKEKSLLERRVGLLKLHANLEAAHISMEPYSYRLLDVAHVVGSMALVGTIIHDFDNPSSSTGYYDSLDKAGWEAGWEAGRSIFPNLPTDRLFENFDMVQQATNYWNSNPKEGLKMLMEGLPAAIGWWKSV